MMLRLLLILFLLLISCNVGTYVEINGERINVEVADDSLEMQEGLMFREELCHDCGMLFVFPDDVKQSFWMKNTLIPLQMIFINSDYDVVDVLEAVPCTEDPCEHYRPEHEARYVLEVNSGRFEGIVGENVKVRV